MPIRTFAAASATRLHLAVEPAILFVGRISEDKQPDVLADTMRALHERGASFQLVVAGDGPTCRVCAASSPGTACQSRPPASARSTPIS